jgi:hypothetical protein
MKLKQISSKPGSVTYIFYCLGCDEIHQITDKWEFNNDFNNPTFSPSYLTWNDPNPNADPKYDPKGKYRNGFRCHSFIKEGKIEYLNDCTHKLAGKTVQLPEVEDYFR